MGRMIMFDDDGGGGGCGGGGGGNAYACVGIAWKNWLVCVGLVVLWLWVVVLLRRLHSFIFGAFVPFVPPCPPKRTDVQTKHRVQA